MAPRERHPLLAFLPDGPLAPGWGEVGFGGSPAPQRGRAVGRAAAPAAVPRLDRSGVVPLTSHGALAVGFARGGAPALPAEAVDHAATAAAIAQTSCRCPVCSQLAVLNADVETLEAPASAALMAAASSASISLASSLATSKTFFLHSNPTANHTIYLDFNGHSMASSQWENGGALQLRPFYSDFSSEANLLEIQRIWQRIAEDFAPFQVNVTTQEPISDDLRKTSSTDPRWGVRMAFTYNENLATGRAITNAGGGGTAYIGSFNWSTDEVTLGFNRGEYAAAETGSHEVGHSLNLYHDGTSSTGYYGGHGSGETGWGAIMGAAFIGAAENLTTWSKGEYYQANNLEDDLAIITTRNGFGYRADDHGGQALSATLLSGESFSQFGVIERSTDVDWFRFDTGAGAVSLSIINAARAYVADGAGGYGIDYLAARGPNLDLSASLWRADGGLIATSNPLDAITASFSNLQLAAGTYFLSVEGVGVGSPLASSPSGYTDYASLGQYLVSGTVQPLVPPAALLVSTTTISTSESGGSSTLTVRLSQQPSALVTVSVMSGDAGEVSVSPATLSFTPDNWATAQAITLTGVDDRLVDGAQTVAITLAAVSEDPAYSGLAGPSVAAVNADNDVPILVPFAPLAGGFISNLVYQNAPAASAEAAAALAAVADSDDSRLTISEGTILVTSGSAKRPTTSSVSALSAYQWSFDLSAASRFRFEGFRTANSENDGFRFELSSNGGASWSSLLTVSAIGTDAAQTATLAAPLSGTVLVRLVDTQRSSGAFIDSLSIDRLGFESEITDLRPSLSVAASTPETAEGAVLAGAFTISRSEALTPQTVAFTVSGTAVRGVDYDLVDAADAVVVADSLTLASGQDSAVLRVVARPDAESEVAEAVQLTLQDPGADLRLGTAAATVTIREGASASGGPFLSAGDLLVLGTVSGSHTATHTADGIAQVLAEVPSGGKPSSRTSLLEHQWRFDGITGAGAFRITASTSGSDGEGFAFAYSGDGGASWFGLGSISASQALVDQHWSLATPAFSGSALVRVVDLDRSVGQLGLDQLSIDAMAFVSSAPAPGLDPWLGSPGLALA